MDKERSIWALHFSAFKCINDKKISFPFGKPPALPEVYDFFAHLNLAATYSMMGPEKEASAEAAEVLRLNPKFTLDFWAKTSAMKEQSEIDKFINALRKAGLK